MTLRDTVKGHMTSIITGAIFGISVTAIVMFKQSPLNEVQFGYLMGFDSIVAISSVAWYAISAKLSPTGVTLSPDGDQTAKGTQ